ncbi:M56 family metallopeptidase [Hymenobacter canadensis]|uniref:TonB-dependent receptor plug domain-containing protein n=1 Tax=Hymenobacter canadensis TaxID=2999067 RepID=A0ABY7LKV0_9BACT|nr:M56 family metallopeptidase [Hymenobacter canadensis]WBA41023.1 TonB-dependent receptor plug domain-containing protein [Hymenobacter canadensis]
MPALLLYLLQMQGALLLLLAVYYGLLRRLTFHQLNRGYLLAALALAAVYPLLDLGWLRPAVAPAAPLAQVLTAWPAAAGVAAPAASGLDYGAWLLAAYGLGATVLLLQLLVQVASLWRLHRASRPAEAAGVRFRAVMGEVSPFSFGRAIYLNPAHHAPTELPVVLLHEQVHVRQAHTLDVLLGHLHRVLAWASPAAWLWLRATQENLEFIADAAVLHESQLAPKQYQYSLVRLSTLAAGPALVTPFSFIILKNRIRMMNSRPSARRQLLRYAAVLPVALGLLLTTAATQATAAEPQQTSRTAAPLYFVDGKRVAESELSKLDPKAIESMNVLKGEAAVKAFGAEAADGAILVITKQNKNSAEVKAFMQQYSIVLDPTVSNAKPSLYFLDGQPSTQQAINALNRRTIASVNVVKGPDATSVFGVGAADGVMVVVTKRNVSSETVAEFNRRYNIQPPVVPVPPVQP